MKQENRYLPSTLLTLIQKCDYKRKDDLYCIVDLIYRKQITYKTELQKKYGFAQIHRNSFMKFIADPHNIKAGIDYLASNQFIIKNDFYKFGLTKGEGVAKAYKIADEYLGSKVSVLITDKNINLKIAKQKLEARKIKVKNLEFAKSKYYKNLKIDREAAINATIEKAKIDIKDLCLYMGLSINEEAILNIINCTNDYRLDRVLIITQEKGKELHNILHRLMVHQQQIYSISDGNLFFKRNETNGRLDTNLTSLPSYLRKFIQSDENLFNLDITNSQPYFLYTKLINETMIDKKELDYYGKLVVSGQLYEFLGAKYYEEFGREKNRGQIKKMLFGIFYSKVISYPKEKTFFTKFFPTIMDYINMVNNTLKHNDLAIAMQERESMTVLDIVMPKLKELNIKPYTIHDSFIITESELPIVKEIFLSTCIELFGIAPQLHTTRLVDEIVDEVEDFLDLELEYDDNNIFNLIY
jgi:hypothetical protein